MSLCTNTLFTNSLRALRKRNLEIGVSRFPLVNVLLLITIISPRVRTPSSGLPFLSPSDAINQHLLSSRELSDVVVLKSAHDRQTREHPSSRTMVAKPTQSRVGQPTRRRVTFCMRPVSQCSLLPTGHRSATVAPAVMDVVVVAVEAVLVVVTAAFSNGCSGCLDDCVVVFVS